jgi:four helix bundle protein
MKVALKELRETFNALRIVKAVDWLPSSKLEPILNENNQLIAIFVRSIETATTNDQQARVIKKK